LRVILDHSVDHPLFRKDREYAACRICGAVFQPALNTTRVDDADYRADPLLEMAASLEIVEWRQQHNRTHRESEHISLQRSGRTFTPEAAQRLAPYGIVSLDQDDETVHAQLTAPRAPSVDIRSG
jgi:hypothetical protein